MEPFIWLVLKDIPYSESVIIKCIKIIFPSMDYKQFYILLFYKNPSTGHKKKNIIKAIKELLGILNL